MKTLLAWHNLTRNKARTSAATAGIAFVITLIFVQLGLRAAIVKAAMHLYDRLNFDIILVSPNYMYINSTDTFPRTRLYNALTVNGVESARPFYIALPLWRNPQTGLRHHIQMMGFNPGDRVFLLPEIEQHIRALRKPDTMLIDRHTRPEFGPQETGVVTELDRRKVIIAGQYSLGSGFAALGAIIVSDQNFSRVLKGSSLDNVNLGLVKLVPGVPPDVVAQSLRRALPTDVQVLTRAELQQLEARYWTDVTSTGIMFDTGALVAFLVGMVVLYQVLASDITNRLSEYATLKAVGYKDGYLSLVVLQQAFLLTLLGFVPALAFSFLIYEVIRTTAGIPVSMTLMRIVIVFILSVVMCSMSGLIALQKVKKADPADLF